MWVEALLRSLPSWPDPTCPGPTPYKSCSAASPRQPPAVERARRLLRLCARCCASDVARSSVPPNKTTHPTCSRRALRQNVTSRKIPLFTVSVLRLWVTWQGSVLHSGATSNRKRCGPPLSPPPPLRFPYPFRNQRHTASLDGFSLHEGVRIHEHDREGLERLCRNAVRLGARWGERTEAGRLGSLFGVWLLATRSLLHLVRGPVCPIGACPETVPLEHKAPAQVWP
jgi:hypothetical protein